MPAVLIAETTMLVKNGNDLVPHEALDINHIIKFLNTFKHQT